MTDSIMTSLRSCQFVYAGLFHSNSPWIHPERTETTYEIIYVTQGQVFMSEGDRLIRAEKGQLFLLEPHMCHKGIAVSENVGFYWVHFSLSAGILPFSQRFFDTFESSYLLKELLHANNLPGSPKYLTNAILTHILSLLCHQASSTMQQYTSIAEKLYEWIRIHATARLKVSEVAAHFGYSNDHITKICKSYYGVGTNALINRFLLLQAKELLSNTDIYVKEIAERLAFPNDKAFIGFFKHHEGCTPTDFRNRYGKLHMNSR